MEPRLSIVRPSPLDVPAFLPYASAQLQAPYRVRVLIETQEEYVSKTEDKSKKSAKSVKSSVAPAASRTRTSSQEHEDEEGSSPPPGTYSEGDEVVVTAVRDCTDHLVELTLVKCPEVPRLLMQIVALCVPHQPLLARLTVRRSPLGGEALHEIAKFIPLSNITEVLLDDSPVPERNYGALLEHDRLRRLSLARCDLDDDDCAALAERLRHPRPASRSLRVLSLASNAIGDVGAAALGVALRSNRTLQHLDLAGNRLTDDGARALLRSLVEFPLTYEELTAKRRRLFDHLRRRREVYLRCVEELTAAAHAGGPGEDARGRRRPGQHASSARQRKSVVSSPALSVGSGPSSHDALAARAEALTNELIGAYEEPFSLEETVSRDSYLHSVGNTVLCYLNLAYNELGPGTVGSLLDVLRAQAVRGEGRGLLRVLLEGNLLPCAVPEYTLIQELLERAMLGKLSKQLKKSDKPKTKGK